MQRLAVALVFLIFLAAPLTASAQPPAKVVRIGFLGDGLSAENFARGLRDLGYSYHTHFVLERRGVGSPERIAIMSADLVRLQVDLIVAMNAPTAAAAKSATKTTPIVMVGGDPVGSGLVASLARPGGNVTGISSLGPEVRVKRLELLKETVPRLCRVAVLNTSLTAQAIGLKAMEAAAQSFGITLSWFVGNTALDYVDQVAAAAKQGAGALLVFASGEPAGNPHDARLIELIGQHRLPAMFDRPEYARAGGLMSFGPNLPALARRAAHYVDRIVNGVKPADLPVEQPTKFELVINMKTARALGLTIPQSVLLRADEIVQ